jgi:dihydrofolate reductase
MEAILAIDNNNGISKNGVIPWKSKKDMSFFYKITQRNIVIMGKNTFFSIPPEYRPLSNRLNIVYTREPQIYLFNEDYNKFNNLIFTNNDNIYLDIMNFRERYIEMFPFLNSNFKIIFIGGKNIYENFIHLCSNVWVTYFKKNFTCDLFLNYNFAKLFKETIIEEDDELTIIKYEKVF